MRSRTILGMSTYVSVVISPATTTRPVVISVSHATRPSGSSRNTASSTVSETWSAILSGWPSVTDSEVNRNSRPVTAAKPTYWPGAHSLLSGPSAHQAGEQCGQIGTAENSADPFGDRDLDADAVREVAQNGCRRQSLHGLSDLRNRL